MLKTPFYNVFVVVVVVRKNLTFCIRLVTQSVFQYGVLTCFACYGFRYTEFSYLFFLLSLQRPGVLQLQQLLEAQIAETNRLNNILASERALYGNLAQVVQDAQHAGEARCDHMISYETSFDWLKSIF